MYLIYRLIKKNLLLFLLLILSNIALAQVQVKGYYRKDGTYVQPHVRSNPDGNPYNNYSYPGNTNPYTNKVAPGNPDTYLNNYYDKNNSGSSGNTNTNNYPDKTAGSALSNTTMPLIVYNKYVTSKTLNVRSAPSTNSHIITTLKKGETVIVSNDLDNIDSKWATVTVIFYDRRTNQSKVETGYVYSEYIGDDPSLKDFKIAPSTQLLLDMYK